MNINQKELFESFADQLEGAKDGIKETSNLLLGLSLMPFEPVFELDVSGSYLIERMEKEEVLDIKKAFDEDIIPLYEESNYEEGLKKVKGWYKLIEKNLEK